MDLQVGVKVFLKNAEGKYLILRRSLVKYPEVANRWDIVGGRIEVGTPLLANLAREVLEETGLTINSEPKLLAAQDILRISGRHVVRLTYTAHSNGVVKLDEKENDAYQWLTIEELHSLAGFDMYAKEIIPLLS